MYDTTIKYGSIIYIYMQCW